MEATTLGRNRTGATMSPAGTRAMVEAAETLTPVEEIDTDALKAQRMRSIEEADSVGSVPIPPSIKGMVKAGVAKLAGESPTLLIDKLGERLAFERSGVRLYDALLTKAEALANGEASLLATGSTEGGQGALEALRQIRNEELAHFRMISAAIETLGGDPTVQTPCADVVGTASIGYVQVLTDPRTTLAQCLNIMLSVELTDNAGWELLIPLASASGHQELVERFTEALANEQSHMLTVRQWLEALVNDGVGTKAV